MVLEKGYAKINIALEVLHKRSDGYHELDMVLAPIALADDIQIEKELFICIEGKDTAHIPQKENLAYKAAMLLKEQRNVKEGAKITIIKNIPEMAGLAGGSADAAAVLRGLNRLWNLGLTLEELAEIGLQVGSDVPYCIYNHFARVQGRGERITPIDMEFFYEVLLVHPGFECKTKDVFRAYQREKHFDDRVDRLLDAIERNIKNANAFAFNDLEDAIKEIDGYKAETIQQIKKYLLDNGAFHSLMSGSGSVIYGLFSNGAKLEKIEKSILETFKGVKTIVTRTSKCF